MPRRAFRCNFVRPMARGDKLRFDLRDLATALLRHEGIHVGRWRLDVDFSMTRAEVGPSEQGALPGVVLAFNGLELQRCDDAPAGSPQVFDATKENPA